MRLKKQNHSNLLAFGILYCIQRTHIIYTDKLRFFINCKHYIVKTRLLQIHFREKIIYYDRIQKLIQAQQSNVIYYYE